MKRRKIYVVGTGGLAREVRALIETEGACDSVQFAGFISKEGDASTGSAIDSDLIRLEEDLWRTGIEGVTLALGVGTPSLRAKIVEKYTTIADLDDVKSFPNIFHPSFIRHHDFVHMGVGNTMAAGCIATVNIRFGDYNHLNLLSTIGHDVTIGSFNVINPGTQISGDVTIGDRNLIGTNATILQGLTIGDDCVIGAGSVVTRDLESGYVYVGSPARKIRANNDQ